MVRVSQRLRFRLRAHDEEAQPVSTIPRAEYPRPQLRRARWENLNGVWRFKIDDGDRSRWRGWQDVSAAQLLSGEGPLAGQIVVPFCPESQLSQVADPAFHDVVWYARTVATPAHGAHERVLLHFGAVDYAAEVWVNGKFVVAHEGGYTPFSADITDALRATENTLVVRATDPGADPTIPRGKQDWREHPAHMFYSRTTGIWQTVWLEVVDAIHVAELRLTPDLAAGALTVMICLNGWLPGTAVRLTATIDGSVRGTTTVALASAEAEVGLALGGGPLRPWSPEHPDLYDLRVEILDAAGHVRDDVRSYFGMREIKVAGDRLLLNGEPLFLRLVLDQGHWPDGLMTAPSDGALRRDIELAIAMGFNGARKHQKIEDPRWLYWADRLGFLVWVEMPNAHQYSPRAVQRTVREWCEVIARDYSHACVIAWVPLNESFGCRTRPDDAHSWPGPFQASYATALYSVTKALDSTRPVLSNDGWEHTTSDLCTVHDYGEPAALGRRFMSRSTVLAPQDHLPPLYADGYGYEGQPIVASEVGGIFVGAEPGGFGYAVASDLHALEGRLDALVAALLSGGVLSGFCYTQLTDVEQEQNGLATSDRSPKLDPEQVRRIVTSADEPGSASPKRALHLARTPPIKPPLN
jgi:beta-galactosidase/beta-glucuronidase